MPKPSLKLENLNAFKNCGDLIPLPQPNIQQNTINIAQRTRSIFSKILLILHFQLQFGFSTKIYSADSWEH